jgi:ABC-type branched-subunit amino acid transport system ATPase component
MTSREARWLSSGERKTLAIARALVTAPTLVIFDEPTSGLSPQMARRVLTGHVRTLAAQGTGVLMVEQRVLDTLEISDWAYVMVAGRIAHSATARDMVDRSGIADVFLGDVAATGGRTSDDKRV